MRPKTPGRGDPLVRAPLSPPRNEGSRALKSMMTAALVLLASFPAAGAETLRWSGRVEVTKPITVKVGDRVVVEPGTTVAVSSDGGILVRGELYALGTQAAPVRIEGARDAGAPLLRLTDPGAVARLHRVIVVGAATGLDATAGTVIVTDSEFRDNGTALRLQMRTRGLVRGSRFVKNALGLAADNGGTVTVRSGAFEENRVGIGASNSARIEVDGVRFERNDRAYAQSNGCDATLRDCTFTENEFGLALDQSRRSPGVLFCRFERNRTAVAARSSSHPLIEGSVFRGNAKAVEAVRFSGPFLRYDLFAENDEAVRLDHKSAARVEGNRFEANGVALFADFSSYPRVKGNLFTRNRWHVRLGRFMSADWERRQGSRGIMLGRARDRNTRNPVMLRGDLPEAAGTVSVAGNAWDAETLAEMEAGPGANLSRIWDGRDQPEVTYPGWGTGEEAFALDIVAFDPPLREPPPTGPEAWTPLETGSPPPPAEKGPGAPAGLPP